MKSIVEVNWQSHSDICQYLTKPEQPLVFRGFASHWPLIERAKKSASDFFNYLNSHHQSIPVGTGTLDRSFAGRLFYNDSFSGFNFERNTVAFGDFIHLLKSGATDSSNNDYYMGSTSVDKLLPNFRQSNDIIELGYLKPLVSLWLSNKTIVAAHQDLPDNIAVCIAGKRKFTVFPPDQVENLYVGPLDLTPAGQAISLVNHRTPDFDIHPKYKQALTMGQETELHPGDILLLPSMWWHSVESLDSVNGLINYWWQQSPIESGAPMDALLHALMNINALPPHQKQAIEALFKHYIFSKEENRFSHIPKHAQGILDSSNSLNVRKLRAMLLNKLNQ